MDANLNAKRLSAAERPLKNYAEGRAAANRRAAEDQRYEADFKQRRHQEHRRAARAGPGEHGAREVDEGEGVVANAAM